ncbi:MAG: MFS transporter [Alkalispirochaeta sp.]
MVAHGRPSTTVTAILASVFLLGSGSALQGTAVTLRAGLEGFSEFAIGLISSGYFGGVLAGSFLALLVIRNVGYVRALAAFASLASASSLVHVLWIHPTVWFFLRVIHGICLSVVLVVVESWLNATAPAGKRGQILSIYGVVYLAALGGVQPLVSVFPPATFSLFGITSIMISLCILPVTLAQVSGSPQVGSIRIRVLGMFRKSPMGSLGVIVNGLVTGAHLSLSPRFAQGVGMSEGMIGVYLLVFSLGTMALQMPLGWISDHYDRRRALLVSSAVGTLAAVGLSMVQSGGAYAMAMAFAFGGFAIPLYSLAVAAFNDQVSPEEMVEAAGALYVFYGLGSVIGPIAASAMMSRMGLGALYLFSGGILAIYMAFGVLRIRLVPTFRIRGRVAAYRTIPRTTMMAYTMLRRITPRKKRAEASPAPAAYDGFSSPPGGDAALEYHSEVYSPEVYHEDDTLPEADSSS